MIDGSVGAEYEKGLANLKALAEKPMSCGRHRMGTSLT